MSVCSAAAPVAGLFTAAAAAAFRSVYPVQQRDKRDERDELDPVGARRLLLHCNTEEGTKRGTKGH